jgi:hypothetical protein
MPIPLTCTCGRSLKLRDELAGKKIRCPECAAVLGVPVPKVAPAKEDILVAEAVDEEYDRRTALRAEPPPPRRSGSHDAPSRSRKRASLRYSEDPRRDRNSSFGGALSGTGNAGVLGGLLMILIAVVWFVGGAALGVWFIYPPILFVIGIVAIIRGAVSGGD